MAILYLSADEANEDTHVYTARGTGDNDNYHMSISIIINQIEKQI